MTDPSDLRSYLARTWYPFLGRFPKPTSIQRDAIPRLLRGESLLLASATATGKTEAYTAPLVERLLVEKWRNGPSLLIVSPTRALVNDLYRRLEVPLRTLGVSLARKTGDHSAALVPDGEAPPAVLITTPESLDSMLSRRPEILRHVRAIVLDELHVPDGTARGDQLAILVTRLERLVMGTVARAAVRGASVPLPLQRVGATATAADTAGVARRYLGDRAGVVRTDELRAIEADFIDGASPSDVLAFYREHRHARKVLVFANSRSDAENFAAACAGRPPFGSEVFVHHASLARNERERVEKRFLGASGAICFATTTLELGIDIGDIDEVGLLGPPVDVQSLLQRVGRGNRRQFDRTKVACFCDSPGHRARFEHMLNCARRGEIHAPKALFRPSVLVQQALSLLYQNRQRWVDAESLHERLPSWVAEGWSVADLDDLLHHLANNNWLYALSGRRFGPGERAERMFERGTMHSNIASSDGHDLEIVDAVTERVLGHFPVPPSSDAPRGALRKADVPSEIVLGGKRRQVQRVTGKQVRVTSGEPAAGAQFLGGSTPTVSFEHARSLARFLGVGESRVLVVRTPQTLYLGHFLGTAYGRLLLECLRTSVRGLSGAGNAFVVGLSTEQVPDLYFTEGQVLAAISKHRRALSMALGDGPMASYLPEGWWTSWLQQALDVPAFLSLTDTFRVEDAPPALMQTICGLAPNSL